MNQTHPQPKKKLGCWFYGCTSLAVLALIGIVAAYFVTRHLVSSFNQFVQDYTATNRVALERVTLPEPEMKQLQARVDQFANSLQSQTNSAELTLTDTEINALISTDKEFSELKDKVLVMIEDDQIKGRISFPLQDIGPLKLGGRYLNGNATFKITLENGNLRVTLNDVEVNGQPLPDAFLKQLKQMNLAQDIQQNPDASATLDQFDSIQVQDGKLILKSKGAPR